MNARPIGWCMLLVLLAAVLVAGGCSSGVEDLVARPEVEPAGDAAGNPPLPPPPPPPPAKEPGGQDPDAPRAENETLVEPQAVRPTATVPEPSKVPPSVPPAAKPQAAPTGQPSIRLSMGVALAQTLPTGTAMGFSVDYEFTQGQPNPSSRYVWVIEPTKGQPVKLVGPLTGKDTLQVFVRHWRPENGPFQTHIEDASGNRLSRSIPLR